MKISEVNNQNTRNLGSEVNQSREKREITETEEQKVAEESKEEAQERVQELTKEGIEEVTEKLNETVQTFHEELQFQIHEESDRMMAKIVNIEKHETIKELPPKEMLDMLGKIRKMVGLIIDEKI